MLQINGTFRTPFLYMLRIHSSVKIDSLILRHRLIQKFNLYNQELYFIICSLQKKVREIFNDFVQAIERAHYNYISQNKYWYNISPQNNFCDEQILVF